MAAIRQVGVVLLDPEDSACYTDIFDPGFELVNSHFCKSGFCFHKLFFLLCLNNQMD
jgi:hypothetical protein